MALLPFCYETDMRFPGFGIHRVRYYWTDKDWLSVPTVYGTKNWIVEDISDKDYDPGDAGEVMTSPHVYRNGDPPASCTCTRPEGSPAAWLGQTDSSSPTFEPCVWGAEFDGEYSDEYDSLTFAEE